MYSLDDEFGNQITTGVSYETALHATKAYMAAHKDAPCVEIYGDDESWTLDREQVLEGK